MNRTKPISFLEAITLLLVIVAPGFSWLRAVVTIALAVSLFDRTGMFDLDR